MSPVISAVGFPIVLVVEDLQRVDVESFSCYGIRKKGRDSISIHCKSSGTKTIEKLIAYVN